MFALFYDPKGWVMTLRVRLCQIIRICNENLRGPGRGPGRQGDPRVVARSTFDAVLPGRLICRLREQGWPTNLILWIASFATGQSVQIQLDGEIGPSTDIACGLPQGSPVSGILFMLYIAPLFRLGNPKNRFGYADDAANLAISTSLATNYKALSTHFKKLLTRELQRALHLH
ncbi:hypothetical protein TSTA_000950 [Talaromyces stipitatus ATCC 10500]|uniref:Reverse transcriptase domain-containing protein n=1 Tax=Talaromyces stipitatus (strain ATCC 10500 / CBS 375.48 / QM 6759 / NRRL 1006) TaxID=441959 RepID=B8MSW4_TALSN|nr:uncharacterized protein TSTA_000950 [Talaromyces stipitatus ATCC 10500]EED12023.1 hypothetical protein TSTA_000950 [Talaromyces stipitatus ATCC 10500]